MQTNTPPPPPLTHTPPNTHTHIHNKSLPHPSFFVFSVDLSLIIGDFRYSFLAPGFLLHPISSPDHFLEDTRIQLLTSVRILLLTLLRITISTS